MSRLEIILSCILALSTIFNIGVFLYARAAIIQLLTVSEELGDLQQMTNAFAAHTKAVYEMDMFYGEPVIKELIDKTKLVREELQRFEDIYGLTTDAELLEEEMADDEAQEEAR